MFCPPVGGEGDGGCQGLAGTHLIFAGVQADGADLCRCHAVPGSIFFTAGTEGHCGATGRHVNFESHFLHLLFLLY